MQRSHRVAWDLHYKDKCKGSLVLHFCDNPKCVNPDHLWLGTHKDNMEDMRRKGRGHKTTHNKKYSDEEQHLIVANRWRYGKTNKEYCKMLDIDRSTLRNYEQNVKRTEKL